MRRSWRAVEEVMWSSSFREDERRLPCFLRRKSGVFLMRRPIDRRKSKKVPITAELLGHRLWRGERNFPGVRYWEYVEPDSNYDPLIYRISEHAILSTYGPWWYATMNRLGRHKIATPENCIHDFIVTHWAEELK